MSLTDIMYYVSFKFPMNELRTLRKWTLRRVFDYSPNCLILSFSFTIFSLSFNTAFSTILFLFISNFIFHMKLAVGVRPSRKSVRFIIDRSLAFNSLHLLLHLPIADKYAGASSRVLKELLALYHLKSIKHLRFQVPPYVPSS